MYAYKSTQNLYVCYSYYLGSLMNKHLAIDRYFMYVCVYVSLCVGGSKGKVGIQISCIPESRDTNLMYP